ncbi:MAG: hypothetical protein K2Y21_03885 [Phycisphaerales bacterium]|nr:hypothetical protein [Phycisphaerales bacterium]
MNRSAILIASTSLLIAGALAPAALGQCGGMPKPAGPSSATTGGYAGHGGAPAAPAARSALVTTSRAQSVNKMCPIKGGEVDADSPTRPFKGVTIGFCCPGCEGKWDKKTDDEKMALLAKNAPEAVTAIEAAAKSTAMSEAKSGQPDAAGLAANPTVKIARGYLEACAKADAAALDALFLDKGRATVSENAGDEGTWETYRDHHLLPELKEMPGFVMTVTKEDVQTFGTTSIVRQIGSFTVPDPNHPDASRKFLAAVTYVVVDDGGTPKIAHLHWSSRAEKKPAADATAKPDAPHGSSGGHGHK